MKQINVSITPFIPALRDAIRANRSNEDVVGAYHKWNDLVTEKVMQAESVSCKAGCAHCCEGSEILINKTEARLIARVTGKKANLDVRAKGVSLKGIPCPFLDPESRRCNVYENRPATCRAMISMDDPAKCITEENRNVLQTGSLLHKLNLQLGHQDTQRLKSTMGSEADIREFFAA